ncbi:MAG: hypothetical protein EBX02_11860 [Betaproteobacteria bacterium]|nr:hypothetical protein [Betaproteobacteria bacterium]
MPLFSFNPSKSIWQIIWIDVFNLKSIWPSYNPNQRSHLSGAQLRNRVITDTFEPGSTMKPFTTALALNSNRVRPESTFNVAPGRMTIGNHTINDAHPYGVLTVEQILQKSSNVGTAKMALQMPPEEMWRLFTQVGFGQAPDIGFPGAVAGRVRPHRSWKPIEQATMSYGHGISVSLLQLARAYSIFARDGELIPITMQKHAERVEGESVIRKETAKAVRHMLELAAGPGGTSSPAWLASPLQAKTERWLCAASSANKTAPAPRSSASLT